MTPLNNRLASLNGDCGEQDTSLVAITLDVSPQLRQSQVVPTVVHLRSGTPFGFPPESAFTFTRIPTYAHLTLGPTFRARYR